jgi:glycosyltransferase involved in cell wall biosynthesis
MAALAVLDRCRAFRAQALYEIAVASHVQGGEQAMKLSVIVPVYNEIATLAEVIRRVRTAPLQLPMELILVDDYSVDGTREYLKSLAKNVVGEDREVKVFFHERNLGKGAAIRTAISHATGTMVLIQDADLEYDPQDYGALLKPILEDRADVVFGNRFHGGTHRVLYFWHFVGNRFLTTLCNMLTNLNLTDMEVGYKVFRAEILRHIRLESNRFGFEPEITIKLAQLGCRIYEVPISYYGRTYAEGKKISWRDGIAALFHIIRYRFFP